MTFHEYPKMVIRRDDAGVKKASRIVNSPTEEEAYLALSLEEAMKGSPQVATTAPPAPVAVAASGQGDEVALRAEVADLKSRLAAVESEKAQLREALESAKVDFLALQTELAEAKATIAADLEADAARHQPALVSPAGEGRGEPDLPENWRELHHKTLISLAARFVEGVTTKEDAIATLEKVEQRRRGDA